MNILVVTDELSPHHIGGAGVVANQIVEGLKNAGVNHSVLCSRPSSKKTTMNLIYKLVWPLFYVLFIIKAYSGLYDKFIINDLRSAYICGLFFSKRLLKNCVYIVHGAEVEIVFLKVSNKNKILLLGSFYKIFLLRVNKIVCVSHYVKNKFVSEIYFFCNISVEDRSIVSYAGLSESFFQIADSVNYGSVDRKDDSLISLVSVSRLEHRKGYLNMLGIFKSLVDRGVLIHWDIYGSGKLSDELLTLIDEYGLSSHILLKGSIDRNKLPSVLIANGYDTFWLLPCEPEAFGLVYIESASVGLPSIGPDSFGITEAISDGISGYYYNDIEKFILDLNFIKSNKDAFRLQCKDWSRKFNCNKFLEDLIS